MMNNLPLELARERLSAAWTALAAARARLELMPNDSDEALQVACELFGLKRGIRAAQVEVFLARGPVSA